MIKDIKCIICDKIIQSPRIGQLCCSNKKCKEEFNSNQIELWKINNPDRVKKMNSKSYKERKRELFSELLE